MRVRNPATGRLGSVVRGPYWKFGTEWLDIVFSNDFDEPGRYSVRYRADWVARWERVDQ